MGRRLSITTRLFLCIPVLWIFAVFVTFVLLIMQGNLNKDDINIKELKRRWNEERESGHGSPINKPLEPPGPKDEIAFNQKNHIHHNPANDDKLVVNIDDKDAILGNQGQQQQQDQDDEEVLVDVQPVAHDFDNPDDDDENDEQVKKFEEEQKQRLKEMMKEAEMKKRQEYELRQKQRQEEEARRQKEEEDRRQKEEEEARRQKQEEEDRRLREAAQRHIEAHDPNGPGEMGKPVIIKENELSPIEKRKYKEGWDKYQFNEYASNKISVHRTLPDQRPKDCLKIDYPSNLPDTSIIVVFRNEAWSTLLRTVYSCLDNSPPDLVREMILVDDFSDYPHLGQQLDDFVVNVEKLKVVRAKKREGLIRARLLGSAIAKGEVLTFLDSHVECTKGWLEPLLDRIATNKTNVMCPVIESIGSHNFVFSFAGHPDHYHIGGYMADLYFNWFPQPASENTRRKIAHDMGLRDGIRSPTMAGGLFSIHKDWFEKLGTYDAGMDFWGGENLEISFKIWLCGGTLEIHPCSHVGHIFRTNSPHRWPTKAGEMHPVKRNALRVAEVWLDEYRLFYYEKNNDKLGDFGDVSARKALRQQLHCKNFEWYMNNVWPSGLDPKKAKHRGEIRNPATGMCVDAPVAVTSKNGDVKKYNCHGQGGNQYWLYMPEGEIRREGGCLDYSESSDKLVVMSCHGRGGHQKWEFTQNGPLFHTVSKKCLTLGNVKHGLTMETCAGTENQIWKFRLPPVNMPHPEEVAHLRHVNDT